MSRVILSLGIILMLATASTRPAAGGQTKTTSESASHEIFGGVWVLNRDKSEMPRRGNPEGGRESGEPQGGGAPPAGGRRGGGFRGGFGGGGRGGFGGREGGGASRSPEEIQAIRSYMQTVMEASTRITVVVHPASVNITDAEGRVVTLQTNDKKVEERAANGLVKLTRKSRWDGNTLMSELEMSDGPKIDRRYDVSSGSEELTVTMTMSGGMGRGGGGGGGNREIKQVYERWHEQ